MREDKGLLIVYTGPGKGQNYVCARHGFPRGGPGHARFDGAIYQGLLALR